MSTPRIYIACLAAYNAGKLHGQWVNAAQDVDSLSDAVKSILESPPEPHAEEYAIHDYENFEGFTLNEYTSLETVSKLAQAIEEHGKAFSLYANDVGLEEALEHFEEDFQGYYESKEDYARELLDQTGDLNQIPDHLRYYFDFEAYARDLELGGDYTFAEASCGRVAVFNNHI